MYFNKYEVNTFNLVIVRPDKNLTLRIPLHWEQMDNVVITNDYDGLI